MDEAFHLIDDVPSDSVDVPADTVQGFDFNDDVLNVIDEPPHMIDDPSRFIVDVPNINDAPI